MKQLHAGSHAARTRRTKPCHTIILFLRIVPPMTYRMCSLFFFLLSVFGRPSIGKEGRMALQTAATASGKKMKGECHKESSAVPHGTPRRTPVATPRGSNAVDPAVARPGRKNVATARLIFNTIFFLPLTAWSLASKTRASVATICCTTTAGARYFHCLPALCAPFPDIRLTQP